MIKKNYSQGLLKDIETFKEEVGDFYLPRLMEVIDSDFQDGIYELLLELEDYNNRWNFADDKCYNSSEFCRLALKISAIYREDYFDDLNNKE